MVRWPMHSDDLGGRWRPLVEVLVDAGCHAISSDLSRAFRATQVSVLDDESPFLARGGILLLGARTADGASSLGALRRLRSKYPELVVYLCDRLDRDLAAQMVRYARAGLDRFFVLESAGDRAALAECVRVRSLAPPPRAALRALSGAGLATRPQCLTEFALRNGHRGLSIAAVSQWFGVARRTLSWWCQIADLPPPRMLVRCARFLHHEELLSRGIVRASERAARLGFDTATELRQFLWKLRRTANRGSANSLSRAVPELNEPRELWLGW